jgi:ABC-2 type transport system permease protein
MFNQIIQFELRYFLKQPSFYVCSILLLVISFLFSSTDSFSVGGKNLLINGSYSITLVMLFFSLFSMFLVVNFVGSSAIRNETSKMEELVLSKPISAVKYNLAKLLGSYLVVLVVFLSIPIGYTLGSWMPWVDAERLGAFSLEYYARVFLIFNTSTLLFLSSIFYAVAKRTSSMMPVYLSAIALLVLYSISGTLVSDLETRSIAAVLDPFGIRTFSDISRYWSVEERNITAIPLTATLLLNRIGWLVVTVVIVIVFGQLKLRGNSNKHNTKNKTKQVEKDLVREKYLLNVSTQVDVKQNSFWQVLLERVRFEVKQVLFTPSFVVLIVISILFLMTVLFQQVGWFGAKSIPITKDMVNAIFGTFSLLSIVIVTFYSAEVIWRERDYRIADIVESAPIPSLVFWLSKFFAVNLVLMIIYGLAMLFTLGYQLAYGVTDLQISQYFISIILFILIPLSMSVVLSFFIQTLCSNKFVGMFVYLLVAFSPMFLVELGIEHNMLIFAQAPTLTYSDMNGYAWFIETQLWYSLYWGAFSMLLAIVTFGMWQRGTAVSWKNKITQLISQTSNKMKLASALSIVVFISSGSVIYYNTTVINEYISSAEIKNWQEKYERDYGSSVNNPVPTMTSVIANVDIYPAERRLTSRFEIEVENKSKEEITEFLLSEPNFSSSWNVTIDGGSLKQEESLDKVARFVFHQPMQPGESRKGIIEVERHHKGFKDSHFDTSLVKNGTFISNIRLLPSFGVNKGMFIQEPNERKKRELPKLKLANKLDEHKYYNESSFGKGYDFIDFEAIVSTDEGQTAIAPGYLQSEWLAEGRHYFHYKMDSKIKNFYSFLSAELEVKKASHKSVNIEVYYHSAHNKNIDVMIDSVKASLDYFSTEFGDYQHKQMRIIEFPGYSSYAQSFANTVPYAETMGFISEIELGDKVNIPFLVTAHEVAHQWWGHQLGAANVEGAQVLSESLSEYSALKVVEQTFGKQATKSYLKRELDYYLRGRTHETREENPLYKTVEQQYLHYSKGGLVMMSIADQIGVDKVNTALKSLLNEFKYQNSPYPTTKDLLSHLNQVADEKGISHIYQNFKEINLYELKINKVNSVVREDGKYLTTVVVEAQRKQIDGKGKETQSPFDGKVLISAKEQNTEMSSEKSLVLFEQWHNIIGGENTLTFVTETKPSLLEVDPYMNYIDIDLKNNQLKVK